MAASVCKSTPNWLCLTNMAALKFLFLFALSLHLYQGAIADEASNMTIGPILPPKQTIKTIAPHSTAQHTAKPLPPVDCKTYAKTDVDLKQLSGAVYWYVNETGACYGDAGKKDACQFNFAFCRPLPADATFGVPPGKYGASQITSAEVGNKAIILGEIGTIEEKKVDIGLELTVQYRKGDDASDVCTGKEKKLGVDLHLHCDKKAIWQTPAIGQPGKMPTQTIAVFLKEECKYIVTTVYAGACLNTGLSAGTIIIIIFFSLAIVYFVVGLIYNVTKGAHGLELIPNYDMWRMFPADVVGGLAFVWSIITCQGGHKSKVYDDL